MSFNRQMDGRADPFAFGTDGEVITYSGGSYTPPNNVKAIVVVESGDVVCRPMNASADITLVDWPAGALLPWHCKTITQSGTSATLATVKA